MMHTEEHDDFKDSEKKLGRHLEMGLMEHRTIVISEGVSSKLTKKVLSQLLLMDLQDPTQEIKVFLNSPGGSADDGFAIFDAIRMTRAPVKIICTGLTASAGTIILCSVKKERRFCLPNTRIMMHQPSSGIMGTASDIRISADQISKLRERADVVISEATGQPIEKIRKDTHRDFWLDAKEALEYGLVSKVLQNLKELY